MIIAVSGVDGSGKSTQISLLCRALEEGGLSTTVVWFRPGYSEFMDRVRAAVRRKRPEILPRSENPEARRVAFSKPSVRLAWQAMALGDILLNLGARIRLLATGGRVVICDRYLFDSLLDLELRFDEFSRVRPYVEWGLSGVIPRPDLSLLMMVPRETMHSRLEEKEEPFPDPPELRERRYGEYVRWAGRGDVLVVDGLGTIREVHERILRGVEPVLDRPVTPVGL